MNLLEQIALCVENGKADISTPYPNELKGKPGAVELTLEAIKKNISPNEILSNGLILGMKRIGEKFGEGKAFIPNLLISAKAMNASIIHLKPFFESGEVQHKGKIILGTVSGDLHDIGKNIVKMVLEGDGWNVIDLGVDVSEKKFLEALNQYPTAKLGMSALLTTTMLNMGKTVEFLKSNFNELEIYVGGAPLSNNFATEIGANGYFPNPHEFANHLNKNMN